MPVTPVTLIKGYLLRVTGRRLIRQAVYLNYQTRSAILRIISWT